MIVKKNVFSVTAVHANDDSTYWQQKTYVERIEAVEQLRQVIFGYDPSTERLQRILTVTQRKKN